MSRSEGVLWVHLLNTDAYRPISSVLEFVKDDSGKVARARFDDGVFDISPQFWSTYTVELELKSRVIQL